MQASKSTEGREAAELAEVAVHPKYRRLRNALADLVRQLPAGASIPTERELGQRFGVSRGTVRQALDHLEAEQLIYRSQGRGTFVAKPKIDQVLELSGHTATTRARGMAPSSTLVSVSQGPADALTAEMLGLDEGAEALRLERVRLANGEPLAIELLYLDRARFGELDALLDASGSLYELLRSRYGVELAWGEETIEARAASEREADLLGLPMGAPVLLLGRQSFDPDGKPVEYVRAVYRADRFRFRTRLLPAQGPPSRPLPPGARLRLVTAADAPGLAEVFVSAWLAGYQGIVDQEVLDALDPLDIADWLGTLVSTNGPTTWAVESTEGEVLGFSRHGEDPADSRRGHVYSLYVHPRAAGRGIGKALLDHDLRLLAQRGLTTVTLWVFEQNQAARNLYSSFGFEPDGARRVEPEYGAQEIRMRRTAAAPLHPGHHEPAP